MNIPKIDVLFSKELQSQNNNINSIAYSHYGLKMSSPLNVDTVSFGASKTPKRALEKIAGEVVHEISGGTNKTVAIDGRKHGSTLDLAKEINKFATERQKKVKLFVENILKDLVATEHSPKKPILKISGRPKSEGSIQAKTCARGWNSKEEIIDKMEDLNGMKIVMNYGTTKEDVDRILDRFIPYLNSGVLELLEVENKRPIDAIRLPDKFMDKYDYASIKKMEELIGVQLDKWGARHNSKKYNDIVERLEKCKGKALENNMRNGSNYTALHFIFRIPKTNTKFELQIMGPEVDKVKSVDDIVWKYLDNKNASDIYDEIIGKNIRILTQPEYAQGRAEFDRYRADLFLSQREKEIILAEGNYRTKKKIDNGFITVKNYDLVPQYDYNRILIDKIRCERLAEEAKKATAEKRKTDLHKI